MRIGNFLLVVFLTSMLMITGCSTETVIDLEFVKQQLEQGIDQEEVKQLLGATYTEVIGMDDNQVWRYDLGLKEGYTFEVEENLDTVDLEGLLNGSMKAQLFIGFDKQGKIINFSYYTKADDGSIYEYRLMEDGTVKEGNINI